MDSYEVIIVGSGPAGVSVAWPLLRAGIRVLMLDGGRDNNLQPPSQAYLTERFENEDQWKWMLGEDFHALREMKAVSPKLRVPVYRYVFEDFLDRNRIEAEKFTAIGSLARGGLSNAWGCGVASLSSSELADYPFPSAEIERSYAAVARRIGISGAGEDDLSDYFGLDAWSQPALPMDALHQSMSARYASKKQALSASGFRLGRSRVAALSEDLGSRKACDLSANCLWGCHRNALYSSADEISSLAEFSNFFYRSGFFVEQVRQDSSGIRVEGEDNGEPVSVSAGKAILAAGTLATTRLALQALRLQSPVRLQSCPTAAFLLWLPGMLGSRRSNAFGLGQLSFSLALADDVAAFGSTFSTVGIPLAEFARHLPLRKRSAIDLLGNLLSSCVVGNVFMPGSLSRTEVLLAADGVLKISGSYCTSVPALMSEAASCLRKSYRKLGALLLPGSFTRAQPGGDIHYSSTLPMRSEPGPGETDEDGELFGLQGVHIVDGACLPSLTEKSHTLTIMANADRIGRNLARQMAGRIVV